MDFFTGLPRYVVRQYMGTIEEFRKKEEELSQQGAGKGHMIISSV